MNTESTSLHCKKKKSKRSMLAKAQISKIIPWEGTVYNKIKIPTKKRWNDVKKNFKLNKLQSTVLMRFYVFTGQF